MKRIGLISLLILQVSSTYANTCPPVDSFLKEENGWYVVRPPSGWRLAADRRIIRNDKDLHFAIAAWGNHKTDSDHVRCHYYRVLGQEGDVQLDTTNLVWENDIQWQDNTSTHYKFCGSYEKGNVGDCRFIYPY